MNERTRAGWYNPSYCLTTWRLGNNGPVRCQSNTILPNTGERTSSGTKFARQTRASTFTYAHSKLYYFGLISLCRKWRGSEPLYTRQIKLGRYGEMEGDRKKGPQKRVNLFFCKFLTATHGATEHKDTTRIGRCHLCSITLETHPRILPIHSNLRQSKNLLSAVMLNAMF